MTVRFFLTDLLRDRLCQRAYAVTCKVLIGLPFLSVIYMAVLMSFGCSSYRNFLQKFDNSQKIHIEPSYKEGVICDV